VFSMNSVVIPVKGKKFRFVCVLSRERGHLARFW